MKQLTITLCALVLLLVLLPGNPAVAAKSYKMKSVIIKADLATDGSMTVSEERTYRFKSRFKYAYRTYTLDPSISYENFQVSENNQPYLLSDSKEPGTYTITTDDQEIEVRWYYRAKRETRTFVLDYRVDGAVDRFQDTAVLYYQFIGDGFRKSTGNLEITITPPVPLDQWKVRQWAHGPLWGSSSTSNLGVVSASCDNLPKKQFFELRVLYPAEIFAEASQSPDYVVGQITEEESLWADAANLRREKARIDSESLEKRKGIAAWALPLVVLFAAVWLIQIARQYGTRPTVPPVPTSSGNIPSDLPPAIVGYLINDRTIGASSIMATLMDLARRGFLEFREEQELGTNFLGREKWKSSHSWLLKKLYHQEHSHTLAGFENMLIEFVFEELAGNQPTGSALVIVELDAFKKNKSQVQSFFGKWSKEVQKEGKSHDFFDQESFHGRNKGMTLGGGLVILALIMIPVVHEMALIPVIAGAIMLIASNGIVHHTKQGMIQEKNWKSLKSFLTGKNLKNNTPESVLEFIEPYFIYGVVMGMKKNQLDDLGSMIPMDKGIYFMPWYVSQNSGGGLGGDSFGTAFSTAVASVNSSMSSATGTGGGASGGGGGGSGGGGGGAG